MRILLTFAVGLSVLLFQATQSIADDHWQAGAAAAVITPQTSMWMSGYASRNKPSEGTIHDLWAKALVLQDSTGNKCLLITLDLVGIDKATSDSICERLMTTHGLKRSAISLATSHTHSGPVVGKNLLTMYSLDEENHRRIVEYTSFLENTVAEVANEAFTDVAPAIVQQGSGTAEFAVNRRNNREADVPMLREAGQLVGPVDHDVPVLVTKTLDGELKSIVFGYACHATVLSGMDWCGDWPGFAQLEIQRRHPEVIAMFMAGCGADQNPLPRRTVELAENYGQQIADSVDRTLATSLNTVSGKLTTEYQKIDLALDTLPTRDTIESDLNSDNVYIVRRAAHLLKLIAQDGQLSQSYPYPVQVWNVGNQLQVTMLGGEVVVDFALRLKNELSGKRNWVAGYSNDVMAYIPSARVLSEGGYEGESAMIYYGLPTKWSPNVEEHIVRTVKELAARSQ